MTAPMCAIRFSSGDYGPLVPEDVALRAFANIPEERRALCRISYWREIAPEDADTLIPEALDPFSDASIRASMPTMRKGDE